MKRDGEMVKRKADQVRYIKRGMVQADYTLPTVYEWNEYDPEDLYIKQSNLNDLCWDQETGEILNEQPLSVSDIIQHARTPHMGCNHAASTTLFDQLREQCYSLYSNKKLWGYESVLSIARQLGEGQSEKKVTDTAKGVFEWIETEFPKSHDASKAYNGKGTLWANIRWCGLRMKGQLLVDFANKEGFTRQYASKLKKDNKIYEQFGGYFYTKNKIDDPNIYIESFHLAVTGSEDNGSSIHNKHVNQQEDDRYLFESMNLMEVEIEPPIPPPKVMSALEFIDLWD
jgi:hypothetical protein